MQNAKHVLNIFIVHLHPNFENEMLFASLTQCTYSFTFIPSEHLTRQLWKSVFTIKGKILVFYSNRSW